MNPEFLWRMENVLHLYEQPYDAFYPLICFDERPCQLIQDVMQPLPMEAGKVKRENYKYKREGVCNVFIAFQPHTGERLIEVYEHRTAKEYADFFSQISDSFPKALGFTVIQDNLNTHSPTSFYKHCPAEKAFELSQKFSMHYTPKNGSWLNMVEIDLSALCKQCLDRRIENMQVLKTEAKAWEAERNRKRIKVKWQFTNDDAREKFSRFYDKVIQTDSKPN